MQKITEMKSEDLFKFVENFVNVKIAKNSDIVKFSKIILEDQGYQVYQLGEKYNFEGEQRKVEDNEFLVAIPNNTEKM